MDNIKYFHDLFDSALNSDEESLIIFESLLLKNGISTINNLIKKINYKKEKELLTHSLNIYKKIIFDNSDFDNSVEMIFGCNLNNKYYIVIKYKRDIKYKIITNDGFEYQEKLNNIIKKYNKLIEKKWIPMNISDIIYITKCFIDDDTLTSVPVIKTNKLSNIKIGISIGIGIILFKLLKNK